MKFSFAIVAVLATVVLAAPADDSATAKPANESAVLKSLLTNTPAGKESCYWDGTAPFCAGSCPPGYTEEDRSSCGDGACCVTGYKVFCCKD